MIKTSPYIYSFWYDYCLNPGRFDYHIKFVQNIKGKLDIPKLSNALRLLINQYEVFNYHLCEKNNVLYWVENKNINELVIIDNHPDSIDKFLHQPFSLDIEPLYRFGLVIKDENDFELLLVVHHVLLSGRQFSDFCQQLSFFYNHGTQTNLQIKQLQKLSQKYNEIVEDLTQKGALDFWAKIFKQKSLINDAGFSGNSTLGRVSAVYSKIPKRNEVGFSHLFLTWGLLLAKYALNNRYILVYPMSISEADQLGHGAWVNSLPYEIEFDEKETFEDLLEKFRQFTLSLKINNNLKYSFFPFGKILSISSEHALKEGFAQTNFCDLDCQLTFEGCEVDINLDLQLSAYGERLRLEYEEREESFFFRIVYQEECFSREWIELLSEQYQSLVQKCFDFPHEPLSKISVLTAKEYQTQIYDWNNTQKDFPKITLHQLFTEQARKTPQQIALVFEDHHLTYQQLDERSNQLARLIQAQNPTELVCLCLERSLEMVVAILAVLKAGCAYVPMDPNAPKGRIEHMLEDTKTNLILSQSFVDQDFGIKRINLDKHNYFTESTNPIQNTRTPKDLAYVIYTSGTTGLPKGVMVEHGSVINYAANVRPYFKDIVRIDFSTGYIFDLSITSFLLPLLCGKIICIYAGRIENIENYIQHLKTNNIDFVKHTPRYLSQLQNHHSQLNIKRCFVGGEKLEGVMVDQISKCFKEVYDEYGPTETTVGAMIVNAESHLGIGKPYANTKIYILDQKLNPLPIGAIGELYIGGAGVARGYLNRPELTQERFIQNPFAEGRIYKTGDLVRYLPDGNLEYIGRNDFQVKIRGFRVELGEIENTISHFPGIQQCSVQYFTEPKSILVGYYVAHQAIDKNELRVYLESKLPDYMLPNVFISLNQLPLTVNGKLDRKALPIPEFKGEEYIAPRNELEQSIAHIWQELLQVERVGIQDDFFKLGGNSIEAIRIISLIKELGYQLQLKELITQRNIANIIPKLTPIEKKKDLFVELDGEFNLLPSQYWFFNMGFENPHHWNYTFMVKVPPLDTSRLNQAICDLCDNHDALRLRFKNDKQYYSNLNLLGSIECFHMHEVNFTALQSDFNLNEGPTWRIAYIHGYADGSCRLFCAFHHLIMDPFSESIFVEDLKKLYDGHELNNKTASFKEWVINIPKDNYDWSNEIITHDDYEITAHPIQQKIIFDEQFTRRLLKIAYKTYDTQINNLLLSALVIAINKSLLLNSFSITHEGHGRDSFNGIDVSRTIGWFSTCYPLKLNYFDSITDIILNVKEKLNNIPFNGLSFCENEHIRCPNITFNYVGRYQHLSDSDWKIIFHEDIGKTSGKENKDLDIHRDFILDMNGGILNDCLHFSIVSYVEKMVNFHFHYQEALVEVVEHCEKSLSFESNS